MGKTIEIHYETGDSFSTSKCRTTIPLVFNTNEALEKALYHIFEHNEYYQKINSDVIHPMEKDRLYNEMKKKDWFYSSIDEINKLTENERNELLKDETCRKEIENIDNRNITWRDDPYWEFFIYLRDDENKKIAIHIFWCGHFETFYDANIINE